MLTHARSLASALGLSELIFGSDRALRNGSRGSIPARGHFRACARRPGLRALRRACGLPGEVSGRFSGGFFSVFFALFSGVSVAVSGRWYRMSGRAKFSGEKSDILSGFRCWSNGARCDPFPINHQVQVLVILNGFCWQTSLPFLALWAVNSSKESLVSNITLCSLNGGMPPAGADAKE